MHALKKINLKLYGFLTLLFLCLGVFSFQYQKYFLEICTILVLFLSNQYLLLTSLAPLFDSKADKRPSLILIVSLFLVKFIILAGTFYYISRYLRERIIFYLLLYIFQLIILFLSIKREGNKNEGREGERCIGLANTKVCQECAKVLRVGELLLLIH